MTDGNAGYHLIRNYNVLKIKEIADGIASYIQQSDTDYHAANRVYLSYVSEQIRSLAESFKTSSNPRDDIALAMRGLSHMENQALILQNLMEAVKAGESFRNKLEQYAKHKILKELKELKTLPADQAVNSWLSSVNIWPILTRIKDQFRRVVLRLIDLILVGLKTIPMFVELKPKPSIGWTGFLPSFSLQVESDLAAVSLHELLEMLDSYVQ